MKEEFFDESILYPNLIKIKHEYLKLGNIIPLKDGGFCQIQLINVHNGKSIYNVKLLNLNISATYHLYDLYAIIDIRLRERLY